MRQQSAETAAHTHAVLSPPPQATAQRSPDVRHLLGFQAGQLLALQLLLSLEGCQAGLEDLLLLQSRDGGAEGSGGG